METAAGSSSLQSLVKKDIMIRYHGLEQASGIVYSILTDGPQSKVERSAEAKHSLWAVMWQTAIKDKQD